MAVTPEIAKREMERRTEEVNVDWTCNKPGGCACLSGKDRCGWNASRYSDEKQRASLPTDAQERKEAPIFRGVLMYFPDAIAEVARLSYAATQQHHPDKPMHWDKSKSTDEEDSLVRHLMERGTRDIDGQRHSAKAAWRALAMLQREIEAEREQIIRAFSPVEEAPSGYDKRPCYCAPGDCMAAAGHPPKYVHCKDARGGRPGRRVDVV